MEKIELNPTKKFYAIIKIYPHFSNPETTRSPTFEGSLEANSLVHLSFGHFTQCIKRRFAPGKMPLPAIFFQAETIDIVNDAGESYFGDMAYDELKKWGRYKIVSEANQADLILVVTSREDYVGSVGNATSQTSARVWKSWTGY